MQILWPFFADTMWAAWCYAGVQDATGASKLLKPKKVAREQ